MNPINLHITFADGSSVDVSAGAPDFVAFEAKFDTSVQSFANDPRVTYMFFLAWNALKRTNRTGLEFDAWVETVENLEVADPKA